MSTSLAAVFISSLDDSKNWAVSVSFLSFGQMGYLLFYYINDWKYILGKRSIDLEEYYKVITFIFFFIKRTIAKGVLYNKCEKLRDRTVEPIPLLSLHCEFHYICQHAPWIWSVDDIIAYLDISGPVPIIWPFFSVGSNLYILCINFVQ